MSGSVDGLAALDGFTLHAAVAVPARDRRRLERLCRYATRPPLASERLAALPDGTLVYRLKRWRDGTTHILFDPVELLERLAALVPAPRTHLVKYHGVLGPCAGWRDRVVPDPPGGVGSVLFGELTAGQGGRCVGPSAAMHGTEEDPALGAASVASDACGSRPSPAAVDGGVLEHHPLLGSGEGAPVKKSRRKNRSWADLMRHLFDSDLLECPACRGRLRVLAAIQDPEAIRAILNCLGLDSRPPPRLRPILSDLF